MVNIGRVYAKGIGRAAPAFERSALAVRGRARTKDAANTTPARHGSPTPLTPKRTLP
jgi:hypothetical protein